MRFSLVLATIGRVKELDRFLQSLGDQEFRNFTLIIVDQNQDDRLVPTIDKYDKSIPILHVRSNPGLSYARNVALTLTNGDIVGFPDDDCWYPPGLLARVVDTLLTNTEVDGVTGRTCDSTGRPCVGRWSTRSGHIDRFDVWTKGTSASIFLRKTIVEYVGFFDETLGIGAGSQWGSGEESDYLIRSLKGGFKIHYDPRLVVYHEQPAKFYDTNHVFRAYKYSMGMGRVLRKQGYPFWFVLYYWLRPLGAVILSLATFRPHKAIYHLAVLRGRILGWLARV
jgi:glycosyltransferase involved in cell wall biosynthesis